MNTAMTPTATMSLFIYSFFDISDVATYINATKYHLFQKQNYCVRKFSDVVYRKSETTVIGFLSRISHTVERKRTQPRWSYHARKFKLFRRQFVEIRKQLAMPYDAGATKRRTSASYREREIDADRDVQFGSSLKRHVHLGGQPRRSLQAGSAMCRRRGKHIAGVLASTTRQHP